MPIPTSKPLSLSAVQTEYGGTNPISMSEYRSKGNAPATGAIDLWADFNGTSSIQSQAGAVYFDNANEYYKSFDSGGRPHTYNSPSTGWPGNNSFDVAALGTEGTLEEYTTFLFNRFFKNRMASEPFVGKTISNLTACTFKMKIDSDYEGGHPNTSLDSRHYIAFANDSAFGSYGNNRSGLDSVAGGGSNGVIVTVEYDMLTDFGAAFCQTWIAAGMPTYVGLQGEEADYLGNTFTAYSGRPYAFWVDATFDYS